MKFLVIHRRDNLLGISTEQHKNNPDPSESQRAHRMLFAFVEELRQAGELTLNDLEGRIQTWRTFAVDHGYQIGDGFWGELMVDTSRNAICTRESGLDGHFDCALIEDAEYRDGFIEDWDDWDEDDPD